MFLLRIIWMLICFLGILTFVGWVDTGRLPSGHRRLWASDEKREYPDKLGKEALRLWAERERDRAIAEAARRYWDYWLSRRSRGHSAYRLWFDSDQTQKWLKNPDKNPLPPPPPLPPNYWMPPLYPPYPYPYYPP